MTPSGSGRTRHAAARELYARTAAGAVRIEREELIGLLGGGAHDRAPELAAHTLCAHGMVGTPAPSRAPAGASIELRRSRLAAQGVALVGVVATALGGARLWIYGLLFALAALLAAGLLIARADLVDRTLPAAVPRGRWAGAVLAAAITLAVALLVALPVYALRRGWL